MHISLHTPRHLSKRKIESHLAKTLLRWLMQTKFFNKIITEGETWYCVYNPEKKLQISEWVGETSLWPKKLKFQSSRIKTMLIYFFVSHGIVNKEFVPEGKSLNAKFYKGIMDRLQNCMQWVCPAGFCSRHFFLLHNNAPAHKAASIFQLLTPKNVTTLYHPHTLQIYLRQTIFCSPS